MSKSLAIGVRLCINVSGILKYIMKKQLFFILLVFCSFVFIGSSRVYAGCSNVSTFGAIEYEFPAYSEIKDITFWVRSQSQNEDYKFLVEVNNSVCREVNVNDDTNQWGWQQVKDISTSMKKDTNNSIKIVGIEDGVRIDKLLLVHNNCEPSGDGSNCQSIRPARDIGTGFSFLPSIGGTVKGQVRLSQTPFRANSHLEELQYLHNGKIIQNSYTAKAFDTTLLPNGLQTIDIISRFTSENNSEPTLIKERITVNIANNDNIFSVYTRWIKSNRQTCFFIYAGLFIAVIGGLLVIWKSRARAGWKK